jgi:hypothetical protein
MSTLDSKARPESRKAAPLWRTRLLAILAAGAGAALVQVIAAAGGAEMEAVVPGQGLMPIGVVNAIVSGLLAGGLAWGSRALLDRFAPRKAVTLWLIGASIAFVIELIPPFTAEATPGTTIALLVMHVVVAAILVPVFARRRVEAAPAS